MANYLLIESRDPFDSNSARNYYQLASSLVAAGHGVTLFLVENGVLAARKGARDAGLAGLASNGVKVLADAFALQERAISNDDLLDGVSPSPLEVVVDMLEQGHKALWH